MKIFRVKRKHYNQNSIGLTFIELMIVLAILSILIAISYPLYQNQSRKKNRTIAISSLLQVRAQLEKCALNKASSFYDGCDENIKNSIDKSKLYEIIITLKPSPNATSYELTAKKLNASYDAECLSLSINKIGVKTSEGTGSLQRCWAM